MIHGSGIMPYILLDCNDGHMIGSAVADAVSSTLGGDHHGRWPSRPDTANLIFLQQIISVFRDSAIDDGTRERMIRAIAFRLRDMGGRYLANPFNWWRSVQITRARDHHAMLLDVAATHGIYLQEISW